ncbi:hypothetical protein [Pedobacter sp. GR22-6]|uniref:hypothetical protein n=1 Tax=Pedobacter sp. GR22-6 TaxID=3127957 RepID=UPI00307F4D6D
MNTSLSTAVKTCNNCGETFSHGRADKKFCTDACRTDYGNFLKMQSRIQLPVFVKTIGKIILENYKILKKLNENGLTKISRVKLDEMGFNFHYHTSSYTTKRGDTYRFCYDQGYLLIKDHFVLLVVQEEQVSSDRLRIGGNRVSR